MDFGAVNANFKTKNLYKKIASLHVKTLDIKIFTRFSFQIYSCILIANAAQLNIDHCTCNTAYISQLYIMFHVYRSQMLIYQTFSFQNLLLSLNFSLIVSIDYCLLQILIYNSKFFFIFCNVSVPCILIFLKNLKMNYKYLIIKFKCY